MRELAADSAALVAEAKGLQKKAVDALASAEKVEDWRGVASLIGQARGCLELQAKLLGQLGPQVQVNILQAPPVQDFIGSAVALMLALCPGEVETIDAWVLAARDDVDGARSDPAGWLRRRRACIDVAPESELRPLPAAAALNHAPTPSYLLYHMGIA